MDPKADFIVGKQSKTTWSGVYGYVPDNQQTLESRGSLYVVLSIKTQEASDTLESMASLSLDELQRYLYEENIQSNFLDHVELSIEAFRKRLEEIVSREESLSKTGVDFEMTVLVLIENYAYLAIVGDALIAIMREDESTVLSDSLIDSKMQGFLKSGSMLFEKSDRFLLATQKLREEGESLLSSILESFDLKKKTSDFVHKNGIAALVVADKSIFKELEERIKLEEIAQKNEEEMIQEKIDAHLQEQNMLEEDYEVDQNDSFLENEEILPDEEYVSDTPKPRFSDFKDVEVEENQVSRLNTFTQKAKEAFVSVTARIRSLFSKKVIGHFKNNKKTYAQIVRSFFVSIISFTKKVVTIFKREILGIGFDRRDILSKTRRIKRNRRIFAVVLVVLIIGLYLGVSSAISSNQKAADRKEAQDILTSLNAEFDVLASEVAAAKTQGVDKKQAVLTKLDTLESDISKKKASTEYFLEDFESLIENIEVQRDELLLIKPITEPQVITDFGTLFENTELTDLAYANGSLFVSDKSRNVIYKTGTNLLSTPTEHISDVVAPRLLVTTSANEVIVYDQNDSSSIAKFSADSAASLQRFPGFLGNAEIGSVAEVGLFSGNDALYELKTTNQQIFKREKNGSDYAGGGALYTTSNPPNWKSSPDLAKALDISVPFEIYVLIEGKGLQRYLSGGDNTIVFETFNNLLKEDYASLSNASSFDVSNSFLAISDPDNKRVFVFQIGEDASKPLTLMQQFVYRGNQEVFSEMQEVVINEQSRKLFLLDGSKVLRLDF